MQKTTHWDLNTWAGSDPVSLDQMNENFTKIDAAGAQLGKMCIRDRYEACEGFDRDDAALMREELGDVLLQVVFHADIERAAGRFTVDDVCDGVCKKLIFRHPALFSDEQAPDWETLKRREKGQKTTSEAMDGVAKSLPALWRAEKLRKKAGALPDEGSDEARLGKLEEEVSALRRAFCGGGDVEQALGGVLFAAVCAGMNRKACLLYTSDRGAVRSVRLPRDRGQHRRLL